MKRRGQHRPAERSGETGSGLAELTTSPIRPASKAAAKAVLADLGEAAKTCPDLARPVEAGGAPIQFAVAALSLSPFLLDIARAEPALLADALSKPLASSLEAVIAATRGAWRPDEGETEAPGEALVMTRLRQARRRVAFHLALADLARLLTAPETTAWLSRFADAAIAAAVDHLLVAAHQDGKLALSDPQEPSARSGLIVLGMGKLGAGELNYSSDIDIIVFYDLSAGIVVEAEDASDLFARMVRRLVRLLQERTADGYVFRTDLRLRPDPGSTPLAIPVEAGLNYYEGRGQNWERAAFVKARAVAGDLAAGAAFLAELVPFVFRKYLDYAAIADIHSIKRQIHAHKGHGEIAVHGHNVKLGRGGIREIEFFVQTQQLIAGGRMPELRVRRTDDGLDALARARWIGTETAETLKVAYWYLRDVEHRIQMVHDEQSHTLPQDEEELARIALMMGETSAKAFAARFVDMLKAVEHTYARLFEREAALSGLSGNLVFTGEGDDPGTLETLSALGFERPADVSKVIRSWHYGRYRATQSARARERLTELTPRLLQVFGANRHADAALIRFDQFISGLPAGIQLFSLLNRNPALLSLIATIMASAPRLAEIIARRPHVFDGMLDPALLAELPTRAFLDARMKAFLDGDFAHEEILDRLRILAAEQKFLIGVRLLTRAIPAERAAHALTDLADLILEKALEAVTAEMVRAHGKVPGGRVALIGMGKLGSRELTAGSDIDLILLYDHAEGYEDSDGPKPIDPVRYYARLTQRLVAALSAPTAEGVLYEVDLRLRPSGNKGPVATSIRAFRKYQRQEAWTWEHMALTRARVVAGDASLAAEAEAVFDDVIGEPRDPVKVAREVREMRELIETEKPPRDRWDLKLVPGGIIDIEFIAQYLTLTAAADGHDPQRAHTATLAKIKAFGAQALGKDAARTLVDALTLYTEITQLMRLCLDQAFEPDEAPSGLVDLMCRAADAPDVKRLEMDLKNTSRSVRKVFQTTVRVGAARSGKKGAAS